MKITLYHGSNVAIDKIDLSMGMVNKDFGKGLIDMETLAKELAFRKLNRQYFFGTERAIAQLKRL